MNEERTIYERLIAVSERLEAHAGFIFSKSAAFSALRMVEIAKELYYTAQAIETEADNVRHFAGLWVDKEYQASTEATANMLKGILLMVEKNTENG